MARSAVAVRWRQLGRISSECYAIHGGVLADCDDGATIARHIEVIDGAIAAASPATHQRSAWMEFATQKMPPLRAIP
jgi:hypothetical protein